MKKILFLVLVVATLSQIGCGGKPDDKDPALDATTDETLQHTQVSNQSTPDQNVSTSNIQPSEAEKKRAEILKACEAKRRRGEEWDMECYCTSAPDSNDCVCRKPGNASLSACKCTLHPEKRECACEVDASSEACFCYQNPQDPRCPREQTDFEICRDFCVKPESERETLLKSTPSKDGEKAKLEKLLSLDCDNDGWNNKKELDEKTDPCDADTNKNGIVDSQEYPNNTSTTCSDMNDSDCDGISNKREYELELNPYNKKTDFDGQFDPANRTKKVERYGSTDKDLWIVNACNTALANQASFTSIPLESFSEAADIKMYLPSDTKGVVLPLANLPSDHAAAEAEKEKYIKQHPRRSVMLFAAEGQSVYGGLVARETSSTEHQLSDVVDNAIGSVKRFNALTGLKSSSPTIDKGPQAKGYTTHDNYKFATATYKIQSSSLTPAEIQKKLLNLGNYKSNTNEIIVDDFDLSEYSLSTATEKNSLGYLLTITLIYREATDHNSTEGRDKNQVIFLYAFAPIKRIGKIGTSNRVGIASELTATRIDDLTNTTAITLLKNEVEPICVEMRTQPKTDPTYFYLIFDESGSMRGLNTQLRNVAQLFFDRVSKTILADSFYIGVTNIATDGSGFGTTWRGEGNPGLVQRWLNIHQKDEFISDVNSITKAEGGNEVGFQAMRTGLADMRTNTNPAYKVPSNASIYSMWVSDEPDQKWLKDYARDTIRLDQYAAEFGPQTTAFALVKNPDDINAGGGHFGTPGDESGYCYAQVASKTGGNYSEFSPATTESDSLRTLDAMIDKALASASRNQLPQTPISSTLQVIRDWSSIGKTHASGTPYPTAYRYIPRNRLNGFYFDARGNKISFNGSERPAAVEQGKRGQDFIVLFQFYRYKTKTF